MNSTAKNASFYFDSQACVAIGGQRCRDESCTGMHHRDRLRPGHTGAGECPHHRRRVATLFQLAVWPDRTSIADFD